MLVMDDSMSSVVVGVKCRVTHFSELFRLPLVASIEGCHFFDQATHKLRIVFLTVFVMGQHENFVLKG